MGLQHNIGIGGACFIGMYKLAFPKYEAKAPAIGQSPTSTSHGPQMQSDVIFETIKERAAAVCVVTCFNVKSRVQAHGAI